MDSLRRKLVLEGRRNWDISHNGVYLGQEGLRPHRQCILLLDKDRL